ncbi:MAG: DUF2089 domain-containing protein [Candidatus Nanopelagicales bacterium]|nr:DUF2089 domain-containing protein [Candidatus Nanopelagicales bacterium]
MTDPGTGRGPGREGLHTHRAPTTCPVCSDALITLRLGCPSCGTELSGHFDACRFCRLDSADLALLEVFLRSRGNIRDVQAHLGVSYPTARVRLLEVLERLGLGEPLAPPAAVRGPAADDPAAVLADLAAGRIDVAAAEASLRRD